MSDTSRAKARTEAANAVNDLWHAWTNGRPDTDDPEFWTKYAVHDETLADAYRGLDRLTDDLALSAALRDAEEFRRERAKGFRLNAAEAGESVEDRKAANR